LGGILKFEISQLPDNDTLVLALGEHVPVHLVRQGVDMGRDLMGCLVGGDESLEFRMKLRDSEV